MASRSSVLITVVRQYALDLHAQCQPVLTASGKLSPDQVHCLRVSSKRLRACWQMLKPLTRDMTAEHGIRQLKTAAATLSDARDLEVMSSTLMALATSATSKDARHIFTDGHRVLFAKQKAKASQATRSQLLVTSFEADHERWQSLTFKVSDKALLRKGLGRLYEKALKLAKAAQDSGDVTHWHSNRKWVKYLGYMLELLDQHQHAPLPVDAVDMKRLGSLLGTLHDIHCLIGFAHLNGDLFDSEEDAAYLLHQLRTEESNLQWRCEKAARKLLKRSPTKFNDALIAACT